MRKYFWVCLVVFASWSSIINLPGSWAWRRRRRRRSCPRQNCVLNSWSTTGTCSRACGGGVVLQHRSIRTYPRCGGSACPSLYSTQRRRYVSCNTQCCRVNCYWSWNSWGRCSATCGSSATQTRTIRIIRNPSCGGSACPSKRSESRRCAQGICCPVNCVVSSWSSWGSCNARCESNGQQRRSRRVTTAASCRGTPCPTLTQTKSCRGPCCRRDCQVSSWSAWGSCSAPPGRCSTNSGTRTRTRRVTSSPSCGGSSCPTLSDTSRCTPVPIPCKMNVWGSWSACSPNNGKCGAGTQYQTRTVATQPYCSPACPATRQTRSCTHSCCPRDCAVSSWGSWSACSNTCGTGTKTRTRRITVQQYCNGRACPTLKDTTRCSQYNNRDCVMSSWSSWSICSNGCGSGQSTRTRRITSPAVCRGKVCGARTESRPCTDYRENRDCVVNSWGSWGVCSEKCAVGTKQRTRTVKISKRCRGRDCPALRETSQCGTLNNGCQHKCTNGVCSCNAGYYLASNKKNCIAKDCNMPKPAYCAPGTSLGSTCKHANVTCPGGKTTYPVTCSLGCPQYYSIKGASTVTCQTSGQWTSYASSYCRRNNDPPSQITLSGAASVPENQPRGTKIGTFSTVDPNTKDKHTYSIVSGGSGKFELRGADLFTLTTFNYETSPNRFSLVIRSTDNGSPPMRLEKIFTISVTDVNEKPTAIQLSSNTVDENSDVDTEVGALSTADPDNGQSYSYTLLDGADGRFKIQGNRVKVAKSNRNCLLNGGSQCFLNFESLSSYSIRVRSVDSGSPSQSINASFNILLNDVNDQPRDLKLSNYKVKENAPINFKIGNLSASDEDKGQKLNFSLVDDDTGRFALDSEGVLYKAKSTDYETSKVHHIVAKVTDDGKPSLSMTKLFAISVLDVNEAPVSIVLSSSNVKENSKPGTLVGTLIATDTDAVQNLTFKLDDDAGGKFSLQSNSSCQSISPNGTRCTTELLVSGNINYEDTSSLDIIVRVTDYKGLFRTEMFNVTVIDVNDPPTNVTLDGSVSALIPENSKGVQVDSLITEDEDHGQNFTYVLIKNPGGNFQVKGDKLFTSIGAKLDYESSTSHQITVKSTDDGNPPLSVQVSLVINLQDVNEKPTNITLSNRSVQENKPTGMLIGQLTVSDPDRQQSHVCSLTDSANGKVALSNNQLTVGSAGVNYEDASSLSVKVLCRDPGGLAVEDTFVILVQDVNEAPTSISLSNDKIQENQKEGTVVAQITVTDPDNEKNRVQSFTLSISSSNPNLPFQIQNNSLVTKRPLDYENSAQWLVRVTAKDDGIPSLSRTQAFTIQVIDVNDAPNGMVLSSSDVNENSDENTLVGSLTAVDQDTSQNHTFQLMNSASGRFKVDGNEIKVAISNKQCLIQGGSSCLLNYEKKRSHIIRVKTTDNGSPQLSYEENFRIDVQDINDMPRDLQLSNSQVKEDAKINTLIGRLSSRDEDASQSATYSLTNDDSGRFKVDSQGRLYTAKNINHETQKRHVIRAMVTDNGNPPMKMEKPFTIEVLDVNEAPISINITSQGGQLSFPDGHAQIRENSASGTKIGTLEAFDYDAGQNLTFNLDDDAGGKFKLASRANCQSITNNPGVNTKCTTDLLLNGSLDYEVSTEYSLMVRVTDNNGTFMIQRLKITVVDQNDAPENVTLGGSNAASVNENSNGNYVGTLVTSDQDVNQTHTYKLLDSAGGKFVILAIWLYVSPSANLNYEAQSQFTVRIQSEDNGSPPLSLVKNFTITVIDVNEAPVNITISPASIAENSAPGTVIGQLNVTDPDNYGSRGAWQSHNCQVIGNQVGKFTVQTNSLVVGNANLDYEYAALILVQVRCSDSGSPPLSLAKVLSITVDDVNEAPTGISLSSDAIAENQSPMLIGLFSTADPDNANQVTNRQTFTYTLMGNTAGLPFIIDGDALNSTRSLDFEVQSSWIITVRSVDSGDPALSLIKTFQISVVDVNEKPFNITLSNTVIKENSPQDALVGTVSARDPDFNQTLVYTLIDGAGGRFKLDGNKLKVALSNDDCLKIGGDFCKLNYERQNTYKVSVRATDNGNPPQSTEAFLSITLIDVNDRPRNLKLSSNMVKENATIGTKIGQFSATDEDTSQTLQFALIDSDGGRFAVDSSGYLLKANGTDYETDKVHKIVAQVRDSGNPPLEINKTFMVVVENINEAPINISLTPESGQQSFPDNIPKVNENSKTGTTVGTFHALDHDEVQSLKFVLDDDASGKFTVGSSVSCHNNTYIPGVKTKCTTLLKVSGDLDYETSSSEDILVRVTDDSGLFRVQPFKVTILDVNDRPKNITLAGGDTAFIDENLNYGFVGELATIDEDINQTHSYSLINNGGWKFILRQNKIFSSFHANLDYETKSEYSIAVRSRDNGTPRLSIDKTFTIQVRDVNERPTDIILLSSSVQENSPRGTLVSKISVSDPDNNGPRGTWQNHTCRILNIANIPFILNGTSNSLLVAGDLNYEKTKSYNIDLRCRDNGKPPLSVDETVRVNVTDVNEKPYDITLSNNEVTENAGIVTVGLLDTADPDNEQTVVQTFSYTIVSPAGNIPFVIVSDALNTSRSLDYETKTSWLLEIKSTDNKGLSTTKNFTVIVKDRNDPPTGITVSGLLNVSENSVSGQYLGTVVTADQDAGQTHQYQIVDVVGHAHGNRSTSGLLNLFTVESPSGKVTLQKSGLDYEQYAKYTVTVNSTDSGFPPYSVTGSFVVSVHNINENPQNISLNNNQVLENSPVGTVIGNLSVYDPDNLNVPLQKFNCVVEDGGPFKVDNHLTLVVSENSLDYETIDKYTVNVTCAELLSNPLSVSAVFFINVQDVNEAPYNLTISSQSVSENQVTGYFVGMLSVLDPDLPTSGFASVSLALKDQSPGPDAFQLINSSLVTTRMLDFENQSTYTLTVVATDSGNPPLTTSLSFTIQVIDTNDRPTGISLLSDGIYENATAGAVVGVLRAQDQDVNQSHFFTVNDTDWFTVRGNNLLLSNFSLDYETTPEINVTIEATDNGSPPYSKEDVVSIKVLDSNDRPSEIILNSSLSIPDNVTYTVVIAENSPTGTSLTNLSVVDEDVGQQHRCMLLEGGNNFNISSLSKSSSEIRVKQGANLDYESLMGTPLQLTVNCVDNGNPPYSIHRSFSVQVSDVNEAPFDLRFYGATVIQENVQVGYIVGNVTCKDPDIGQKHIFTVIGNYSSVFQVNNSGDQLYVINSSFLDYEALHVPAVLMVKIQATDVPVEQTGPPLHVISDVNISVVDVNEPPTDIRLIPDDISIPENVSIGYCIAQITSSNPERSQKINYTLLHHQDTFAIKDSCDDNSSVVNDAKGDLPYLTVKSHLSYNHYRIYEVLIEAEDNGIPPLSFNGTVDVNVTKIDPCWSSPCQENSKCRRVDWQNYTCPCNVGYSGDGRVNCSEIDECQSSPCGNGTCHDYVNYYNCTCPRGYHNGTSCSNMINFCLSNPCQNNATCLMYLNGYNCSCVIGFTGLHCEINIDDCASEPCAEGVCLDGINQFTCNCSGSGFFGTRCQRKPGVCLEESCQDQEICVPPNALKYNSFYCISVDNIVSLSFPEGVDTADQQWQLQLENFTGSLTFPMTEVRNDQYDSTDVNAEDIYIISPKLERASKAKRSAPVESNTVDFVILVKSDDKLVGVPKKTVLCSINNTCSASAMEESPDNFNYQLCEATARRVDYLGISSCVAQEAEDSPLTDNKHFTSKRMYYVIGATGGLLLIVLAVSLLLCRRNSLTAKERRLIRSQRLRDNTDDETYTDVMYRHHMANQEMETAAINPIYGTTEEEANITMLDNPIYQEPGRKYGTPSVKRSESTTGFENPMYSRFRPGKEKEEEEEGEEEEEEEEEEDDFKEEKDGAKPPTGFANPMFSLYRQQKTEAGASGDGNTLYAVPVKQEKQADKNTGAPTYETPKKKEKPFNEEPQVVEACGFFNPLYQTRTQVEEFTDITSIFAPRRPQPEKNLDKELPGESDC